ncbi:hypothetical protein ACIGO9_31390 [Nocardia asteroides]|uniref:hypothetical protein n=1 Tax=Nocardia asteroides TaxID=1824 RepID=UPI0037CB7A52
MVAGGATRLVVDHYLPGPVHVVSTDTDRITAILTASDPDTLDHAALTLAPAADGNDLATLSTRPTITDRPIGMLRVTTTVPRAVSVSITAPDSAITTAGRVPEVFAQTDTGPIEIESADIATLRSGSGTLTIRQCQHLSAITHFADIAVGHCAQGTSPPAPGR